MYAINQSKFQKYNTFISLLNSQNLLLYKGLVNIDISPLLVVSQEVMSDVYVFSVAVFNMIIHQADCTLIIT
jgi:hypothetical protein